MLRLTILLTLAATGCMDDHCETYRTQTSLEGRGIATRSDGSSAFTESTFVGMVSDGAVDVTGLTPDISLTPDTNVGSLGFDATPIAQALNDLRVDLLAVVPGTVLVGREYTLPMAYASYGWSGATATMTAKVVAPQSDPAPLLTLEMHMSMTLGGTPQTFSATQDVPLHSEQIGMDICGHPD